MSGDAPGRPPPDRGGDTAGDGEPDPGLQHERTELAWDRTALALMAVGALGARVAVDALGGAWLLPGLLTMAAGGLVLGLSARDVRRRRRRPHREGRAARRRTVRVVGVTAVGAAAAALLLVLARLVAVVGAAPLSTAP